MPHAAIGGGTGDKRSGFGALSPGDGVRCDSYPAGVVTDREWLHRDMPTHVDLDRKFERLSDEDDFDPDALRARVAFGLADSSWDDLLKEPRVVILAEAGTGKTHELRTKAEALKASNHAAFFCRIEDLGSDGLPEALDPADDDAFRAWLEGSDHGRFFLDSVDEACLTNPGSFKTALRHFSRAVGTAPRTGRRSALRLALATGGRTRTSRL